MEQQQIIADIEARARAAGITIAELCNRAGVHPTTFSRWKQSPRNPKPIAASLRSLAPLFDALNALPQPDQAA